MKNLSLLLGVLLLVYDVSAVDEVKSVAVMVGDSVTLNINDKETESAEELLWKIQGVNKFIAKIDRETSEVSLNGNGRFSGRLEMDNKTGSLTINNITKADSRVYQLEIRSTSVIKVKRFNVTVSDTVKNVSVIEGDTVTLKTGVTEILTGGLNSTAGFNRENIHLNYETGEITIRNIRRNQFGDFKVEINTRNRILHIKYSIAVGEMKTVSVREGEPIILYTGLIKIEGHDLILWKFGDHLVAEINKETNQLLPHDSSDGGRFKGRLQPSEQSGSLTVRGSRSTDSGVYHLDMGSSTYSLQRSINVTVSAPDKPSPDPGLSSGSGCSGAVSGISGASVGLIVWAVAVLFLQV